VLVLVLAAVALLIRRRRPVPLAGPVASPAASIWLCPACGAPVAAQYGFCQSCGTPRGAGQPGAMVTSAAGAAGGRRCPACGAAVEGQYRFCTTCGTPRPAATPALPRSPRLSVRILRTPGASRPADHVLTQFPSSIGRQNCTISLPGDLEISRRHAEIHLQNGAFYLVDLGSTNGTFVTNTRLPANSPTCLAGVTTAWLGTQTCLEFHPEEV
jgi:hypothetical protein